MMTAQWETTKSMTFFVGKSRLSLTFHYWWVSWEGIPFERCFGGVWKLHSNRCSEIMVSASFLAYLTITRALLFIKRGQSLNALAQGLLVSSSPNGRSMKELSTPAELGFCFLPIEFIHELPIQSLIPEIISLDFHREALESIVRLFLNYIDVQGYQIEIHELKEKKKRAGRLSCFQPGVAKIEDLNP